MTWRLLYKDNNDVNQVLGVLQGAVPSGAYAIQRARWKPRSRATDKLSVVAEADMYGNLPVSLTDFTSSGSDPDADEPAVYWQGQRSTGLSITGVDTGNDTFTVSGDVTDEFEEGGSIDVTGSTGNDGTYKVAEQADAVYSGGNDETTITVVEDVTDATVDGSIDIYENIFRGFIPNQGVINEQGIHKFLMYDFSRYTGREVVTVASVSTDINDAMDAVLPSGYTLDTPLDANVTYIDSTGTQQTGPAPVDGYTLNDQRKVGYRELTHRYGYTLKFKADRTVRYEPIGFGGSIDTIDGRSEGETNNTSGAFKEWTGDRTEAIINTIRIVNEADGNVYDSGTITNTSSVNTYGTLTPPHGLHLKVGYVQSDAEAKRVAHNIVKDDSNPGEGGVVTVAGRYTQNVSNSSFTLNDSARGISGVFVCWEQTNFYPENRSDLLFQFESDQDREAGVRDDVRAERAQTFADSSTDVGNQTVSADTENVTDSYDAHNAAAGQHDVAGQSFSETSFANQLRTLLVNSKSKNDPFTGGGTANDILAAEVPGSNITGGIDFVYITTDCFAFNLGSSGDVELRIYNVTAGTAITSETFTIGSNSNLFLETDPDISINASPGDIIRLDVVTNSATADIEASLTITCQQNHTHDLTINQPADPGGAQPESDGSTNDTNPSDGSAGDTTSLSATGSTATKNVNITSENKEDR